MISYSLIPYQPPVCLGLVVGQSCVGLRLVGDVDLGTSRLRLSQVEATPAEDMPAYEATLRCTLERFSVLSEI